MTALVRSANVSSTNVLPVRVPGSAHASEHRIKIFFNRLLFYSDMWQTVFFPYTLVSRRLHNIMKLNFFYK